MSGRYRLVALQAVCVAALAAAVYLVILKPDEPSGLSGIDAAGDAPIARTDPDPPPKDKKKGKPPKRSDRKNEGKKRADRKPSREKGRSPGPGGAGPSIPGPGVPARVAPPAPPGGSGTDGGPTGSQYENAVARILAYLAEDGP